MSDLKERIIQRETSKPGMRGKINAKCCECIYDDLGGNGTWRQQIEACESFKCPLHAVRPTSKQSSEDAGS